ncbi:MAG: hypothetical protein ACKO0M_03200 [Cyanobium sp.]
MKARHHGRVGLLLQRHVKGDDYRLNVIAGSLAFAVRRCAPSVVGDGCTSIRDLIAQANELRASLRRQDGVTGPIDPDEVEIRQRIARAGLSMEASLPSGQRLQLRANANLSTGGLHEELDLACVHPIIRRQCESIARTLSLDSCGIDYVTTNIPLPPDQCAGAFLEVNFMPQNGPTRVGLLMDNLLRDYEASLPALVLMANWEPARSVILQAALSSLLLARPEATLCFPDHLRALIFPCLGHLCTDRYRIYRHPREPLLDRSVRSVVYLTTPALLLQRGLPVPDPAFVLSLEPENELQPSAAWERFRTVVKMRSLEAVADFGAVDWDDP